MNFAIEHCTPPISNMSISDDLFAESHLVAAVRTNPDIMEPLDVITTDDMKRLEPYSI